MSRPRTPPACAAERRLAWLLTALWLPVPWSVGTVVGDALAGAYGPIAATAAVGLWAGWGVTLTATLIRRPWALTTVRVAAAAAPAAALATLLAAPRPAAAALALAVAHTLVVAALALTAEVGNAFVDGLSYGNERRVLLRAPLGVLAGPVPLAWAVVVAGVSAGPLLLAARSWALGAVATAVGWAAAALAARALHQLSRRWMVFVPNGFVLHDALATREPILLQRKDVARLAPAEADVELDAADLVDLGVGAPGAVLQATMRTGLEVVPTARRRTRRAGPAEGAPAGGATWETTTATRVLFCPTRPGTVLAEAARRGIGQP